MFNSFRDVPRDDRDLMLYWEPTHHDRNARVGSSQINTDDIANIRAPPSHCWLVHHATNADAKALRGSGLGCQCQVVGGR